MRKNGVLFLQGVDEHAAGGKDVLATRTADGGGQAVGGEVVSKPKHGLFVGGFEGV